MFEKDKKNVGKTIPTRKKFIVAKMPTRKIIAVPHPHDKLERQKKD